MSQKIIQEDHSENVKMFSDIRNPKGFSNFTTNLNRTFGDQSYSNFYKVLMNPKKYKCNSFIKLFEKDNSSKQQQDKNTEETFNIIQFTKSLKKMKSKEKERIEKLKNPFLERLRKKNSNLLKREYNKSLKSKKLKPYFPKVPEVGRYNPSYDIITKHSYQVYFGNVESKKIKEKDNDYIEDYKNSKKIDYKNICKKMQNLNTKNKTMEKSLIERNNKSVYNDSTNFCKTFTGENNHCLKFEVYTPRKPLAKNILYDTGINFTTTNYYTDKYIHNNIDFNKLSVNSRKKSYFDEITERQNNPPLGLYHPKFDSVMNKTRNVYLSKIETTSPKKKKLNKIKYSYNVSTGYQIVPALNDYIYSDSNMEE